MAKREEYDIHIRRVPAADWDEPGRGKAYNIYAGVHHVEWFRDGEGAEKIGQCILLALSESRELAAGKE